MNQYIGTVRLFCGGYIPAGWMPCTGQLLLIEQFRGLAQIIGTTYGGDGKTTFGLPDMRTVVPMGFDPDKALEEGYGYGTSGGETEVSLNNSTIPKHTHSVAVNASDSEAGTQVPTHGFLARPSVTSSGERCDSAAYSSDAGMIPISADTVTNISTVAGASKGHSNMQPYLAIFYIICYEGLYPDFD